MESEDQSQFKYLLDDSRPARRRTAASGKKGQLKGATVRILNDGSACRAVAQEHAV